MMLAIGIVGVAHADHSFSYSNLLNNWTGWYAGMNAGVAFNTAQLRSQQLGFTSLDEACHTTSKFFTVLPGGQIGYMHQFPNELVSGIEANFTFNIPQKNTFTCLCEDNPTVSDGFAFRNRWQSSIKARMGRALNWGKNSVFPYLTAGASFADLGLTYKNEGRDDYSKKCPPNGLVNRHGHRMGFSEKLVSACRILLCRLWKYY